PQIDQRDGVVVMLLSRFGLRRCGGQAPFAHSYMRRGIRGDFPARPPPGPLEHLFCLAIAPLVKEGNSALESGVLRLGFGKPRGPSRLGGLAVLTTRRLRVLAGLPLFIFAGYRFEPRLGFYPLLFVKRHLLIPRN